MRKTLEIGVAAITSTCCRPNSAVRRSGRTASTGSGSGRGGAAGAVAFGLRVMVVSRHRVGQWGGTSQSNGQIDLAKSIWVGCSAMPGIVNTPGSGRTSEENGAERFLPPWRLPAPWVGVVAGVPSTGAHPVDEPGSPQRSTGRHHRSTGS